MKQVTQDLKKGRMKILDVPFPAPARGQVLVRTHYSVISAGTEGRTVADARKGYLAKARARQKEVGQVIDMIKTRGFTETFQLVKNKLEAPAGLGYSCAGQVLAVGEGVSEFRIGDLVACAGASAVHAEVVLVPKNLCVPVPMEVDLKQAAFAAIAAVAIQGLRQADLRFGETAVVIGLGLVGQLSLQLLEAAGVKAIGIDIDEDQVKAALENGADLVFERHRPGLESLIHQHTHGQGADAVIIAAATASSDPVNLAGSLCRKKGRVVIVGAVPTDFTRENYYKKELDLRLSCSYGPGRYDPQYEEHGQDYPIAYVRFTENRNLQTFIDLLQEGKLRLDKIITHTFPLAEAARAYRLILDRTEPFTGILLQYDTVNPVADRVILKSSPETKPDEPRIGLIGVGSFAQNILLPGLKGCGQMIGVASGHGNLARYAAEKYGFAYGTGRGEELIEDAAINTIVIATRHHLHAGYVIKALKKGKHVFVEKPLALGPEELEEIKEVYRTCLDNPPVPRLMVGFNRRFSPHIRDLKARLPQGRPLAMNFRINAGPLPKEHWAHDPQVGGGRIIGELCHFIDLALFLAGSPIASLSAQTLHEPPFLQDTLAVTLAFANGSLGNIAYFSNGNPSLPKERLEISWAGQTAVIDDFKTMTIYGTRIFRLALKTQDKGHREELRQFFQAIEQGSPSPIPFTELIAVTQATFSILDSLRTGQTVHPTK